MENWNIIISFDSYKAGHVKCYDEGVKKIYSYLESRGGEFDSTVFFGLQYYLINYLSGKQVTKEKIDEAEIFWNEHFGRSDYFDRSRWDYILHEYDGFLPITIEAVPEGTVVPVSNVLMTIVNNDPKCFWLTNCIETLLMKVWYPTTIATQSYFIRRDVERALEKSGDPVGINFKVHDFGARGVSSEETAALGAAAHLISFMGTDTVAGIRMLKNNYQAQMSGYSIPATEHSIMCSFGRNGELQACENFIDKFPTGLIACVSDTYDIYNCCKEIWGGKLKEKVMKRDGTLVIRPDSGDPLEVVPKVLQILWDCFGGITNAKGFKVLDSHVRVIQGDGMDVHTIKELYAEIMKQGWSADNLAVGSGGGLLQKVNRDTCKFAIKCSAALKNNVWMDVFKSPVTDPGKSSKHGRFQTIQFEDGKVETRDYTFSGAHGKNILFPVFENGKILRTYSLDQIKANAYSK